MDFPCLVSIDNHYVANTFLQRTGMPSYKILSAKFQGNISKVADQILKNGWSPFKNKLFFPYQLSLEKCPRNPFPTFFFFLSPKIGKRASQEFFK